MGYDPQIHRGRLERLRPEFYQGRAFVHWTMAIEDRATGWLDDLHHLRMREWLCHVLARYQLCCPTYCLMPDHVHFLWLGLTDQSDQRLAAGLFRKCWAANLEPRGYRLQLQPYDHVLREREREKGSFMTTADYVLQNPVRTGLVGDWREYQYRGALVPGYPD